MSSAVSLSISHLPICKSQDFSKDTRLTKSNFKENPCQRSPFSNTKLTKRKLFSSTSLGLLGGVLPPSVANPAKSAAPEAPNDTTSSRMSYSRFLQYLDEGAVRKVDLFENGTIAIAELYNSALDRIQRVKIQMPGLPQDLVRKMKEKNVDFAAHPMDFNWGLAVLDFLMNFGFPLLFLGTLFLRSSASNIRGGPNLPFGLGR